MEKIILSSKRPKEAYEVIKDALEIEASRIRYCINLSKKRLKRFEQKYNISSERFIKEWTAEELKGRDMEYVEWSGEYKLFSKLQDRLTMLKTIKNVAS